MQDGLGITGLIDAGITVALITGRESSMVTRRAQELNIPHVIQGEDDKITALSKLANKLNIPLQHCGYMGDDLIDVAAIRQAGLGVSVPNGCSEAQQAADYVTNNHGGRGAVREVCDLIMQAIDHYPKHLAKYGAN